jgi:hypothetical protein
MIRLRPWPSAIAAILLFLAVSCRPKSSDPFSNPDVVATAGGGVIHRAELLWEADRRGLTGASALSNLLEELADRELVLADARRSGHHLHPEVVELLKNTLAEHYLKNGPAPVPVPQITEAQARDYRDRNPGEFERPERWRIAMLQLHVPAAAGDAASGLARIRFTELASEAGRRIPATNGFGNLSQRSDDDTTRTNGGDAGWLTRREILQRWPQFAHETNAPAVGAFVGPLQQGETWSLLRITGHEPGGPRPWKDVRETALHFAQIEAVRNAALARRGQLRTGRPPTLRLDRLPVLPPRGE